VQVLRLGGANGTVITLSQSGVAATTTIANSGNTTVADVQAALNTIPSLTGILLTGNTAVGSQSITNISSTAALTIGMPVVGNGIPLGTIITGITNATSITISNQATATAVNVALTFNGNVVVTGNQGGPFTFTYFNGLAGEDQPAITATAAVVGNPNGTPATPYFPQVVTVVEGGTVFPRFTDLTTTDSVKVLGDDGGPFIIIFDNQAIAKDQAAVNGGVSTADLSQPLPEITTTIQGNEV
jgi:hypothetical protein